MAASGFFTYYDLYAGIPEIYHQQAGSSSLSTSSIIQEFPSELDIDVSEFLTTTTTTTTAAFEELISSTAIAFDHVITSTATTSDNRLHKFAQLVPFAYFHWLLIGLAILFILLLGIIFACYCLSHCRKKNRSPNKKKQSLPNIYRYRTANRRVHAQSIDEPAAPFFHPSPTRTYPSKSPDRLSNQLLRRGLDAVGSPQVPRPNGNQPGLNGPFTRSASSLLTEVKDRLSTRSSQTSLKTVKSYETQRANMALNDESKNHSLLINMN